MRCWPALAVIVEISALPVSILNGNQQTVVRNARLGLAATIAAALGQFLIGRRQPCTFAPFEDVTPANHDLVEQVAGRLAEAFDRKLDEGVADRVQLGRGLAMARFNRQKLCLRQHPRGVAAASVAIAVSAELGAAVLQKTQAHQRHHRDSQCLYACPGVIGISCRGCGFVRRVESACKKIPAERLHDRVAGNADTKAFEHFRQPGKAREPLLFLE